IERRQSQAVIEVERGLERGRHHLAQRHRRPYGVVLRLVEMPEDASDLQLQDMVGGDRYPRFCRLDPAETCCLVECRVREASRLRGRALEARDILFRQAEGLVGDVVVALAREGKVSPRYFEGFIERLAHLECEPNREASGVARKGQVSRIAGGQEGLLQ